MGFGSRLKLARTDSGFSQIELVQKLNWGSSVNRISSYETEKTDPSLDDIKVIADVLNVNVSWLAFGYVETKNISSIKIDDKHGSIDYISGYVHAEKFAQHNVPYYIFKHAIQGFSINEENEKTAVIAIEFNEHWLLTPGEIESGHTMPHGIYIQFKERSGEFQRIKRELES
jgi:transcriptional regulator with XRE-family HTH domain